MQNPEHNAHQDERLTRLEANEIHILDRLDQLAKNFGEHRKIIEDIRIQLAKDSQRQAERDRYRGIAQAVVIPFVVSGLTLLVNYLIK